jgi:hypothetical protein
MRTHHSVPSGTLADMDGGFQTSPCIARSTDDRRFITPVGVTKLGHGSCQDLPVEVPAQRTPALVPTSQTSVPTSQTSVSPASSTSTQPDATSSRAAPAVACKIGDYVPCCVGDNCKGDVNCQGDQCCPELDERHTTCPSASVPHLSQCQRPKPYDCTAGMGNTSWTGAPPSTTPAPPPTSQPTVSTQTPPGSHFACKVRDYVPCCVGDNCTGDVNCQGDQCCPESDGRHSTCPSASVPHLSQCQRPKPYDCTEGTEVMSWTGAPPSTAPAPPPTTQPTASKSTPPGSGTTCKVGDYVSCCIGDNCRGDVNCQGDQCCPEADGQHTTCPSASVPHLSQCQRPKPYDCTV